MQDIIVSVAIITYNQERYIQKTIESVLMQKTDYKFEILIGDDASKDNTSKIVMKYAAQHPELIRPFINKKNMRELKNMWNLVKKSRGKYLMFLDGDDYWISENKIQQQIDFLEKNKDYAAVYSKYTIVDEDGERNQEYEKWINMFTESEYTAIDYNDYKMPGQTSNTCYRREIVEEVISRYSGLKIFKVAPVPWDRLYVLCALSRGKIYVIPEIMSAYRYVTRKDSGTWASKFDVYTYFNVFLFLFTLKRLEKTGKVLGVPLDYDERRLYEFAKVSERRNIKSELIRCFIFLQMRDRKKFRDFIKSRKKK